MRTGTGGWLLCAAIALALGVHAARDRASAEDAPTAAPPQVTISRADGGSLRAVNRESSLSREFIAIHDARMPVDLVGTPGVTAGWNPDAVRGDRGERGAGELRATVEIEAREPISAVQIVFLTFDVFGGHVRTLEATKIEDVPRSRKLFAVAWRAYGEREVSRHYASLAYVARVRTAAGRVFLADEASVLEEARRFAANLTSGDLDPERDATVAR